jgi:hypothetical protein
MTETTPAIALSARLLREAAAAHLDERAGVLEALAAAWKYQAEMLRADQCSEPLTQFAWMTGRVGQPNDAIVSGPTVLIGIAVARDALWRCQAASPVPNGRVYGGSG